MLKLTTFLCAALISGAALAFATTPETACWDAISGRNGAGIFKSCSMHRNDDGTMVDVIYMVNIDSYKAICRLDKRGNVLAIESERSDQDDCRYRYQSRP